MLAAVYDDDRLLALTLAVAYLPVAFALQAPQWVFFRRMDYVRLRTLQAIVPLGTVRGDGAAAARRRRRVGAGDRAVRAGTSRAVAAAAARLAVPAAAAPRARGGAPLPALLVAGVRHRGWRRCSSRRARSRCSGFDDGLAAAGWITLAATLTRYADRADQILATTIYPAIVRVRDRADGAGGAVRQGQPADADVGVPVRRRARAVRRAT